MTIVRHTITLCLWFDDQSEQAAELYCSVFPNSRITAISRYPDAGQEVHKKPAGSVMVAAFELDGQPLSSPRSTAARTSRSTRRCRFR